MERRLEASRAELLEMVAGLSQERLDERPSPDAWSAGEVLHHLLLVEKLVGALLARMVERAPEGEEPASEAAVSLPADVASVVTSLPVFPGAVPEHGLDGGRLLRELAEARGEVLRIASLARGRDVSRARFPHPAFGRLGFRQWLLFLAEHETGHGRQIRAVLERLSSARRP